MEPEEKLGLNKALDILNKIQRFDLCWQQMDETKDGEFVRYSDIKRSIIELLQTSSNKE